MGSSELVLPNGTQSTAPPWPSLMAPEGSECTQRWTGTGRRYTPGTPHPVLPNISNTFQEILPTLVSLEHGVLFYCVWNLSMRVGRGGLPHPESNLRTLGFALCPCLYHQAILPSSPCQ